LLYERRIRVAAEHLDAQNHVNNVVYIQWIEDTAVAHWEARTSPEIRSEVGWVLLRHEVDYLRPAGAGDEVVVRTGVEFVQRLRVDRLMDMRRVEDGEVLLRSRAVWCPVSPRNGRPIRVTDPLREAFASTPEELDALRGVERSIV
jgi:acyl-CoA thioester hydrolase